MKRYIPSYKTAVVGLSTIGILVCAGCGGGGGSGSENSTNTSNPVGPAYLTFQTTVELDLRSSSGEALSDEVIQGQEIKVY